MLSLSKESFYCLSAEQSKCPYNYTHINAFKIGPFPFENKVNIFCSKSELVYTINATYCTSLVLHSDERTYAQISSNTKLQNLEIFQIGLFLACKEKIDYLNIWSSDISAIFSNISVLASDIHTLEQSHRLKYSIFNKLIINSTDAYRMSLTVDNGMFTLQYFDARDKFRKLSFNETMCKAYSLLFNGESFETLFIDSGNLTKDAFLPSIIQINTPNPTLRFCDNTFFVSSSMKSNISARNKLYIYSTYGVIPVQLFNITTSYESLTFALGCYCMTTEQKYILCSAKSEMIFYTDEPYSKPFTATFDKELNIDLTLSNDITKPIIPLHLISNYTVIISSYMHSNSRSTIFLTRSNDLKCNDIKFISCSVSIIAINPVLIERLWLVNSDISQGTLFAPINYLSIDEESMDSLSMIAPVKFSTICKRRQVIVNGAYSSIIMKLKSITLCNKDKQYSITDEYMDSCLVSSSVQIFSIDFDENQTSEEISVIPTIILTYKGHVNFTFNYGWGNHQSPYKPPIPKEICSESSDISYFSEIPRWPSYLFNIGNNSVSFKNNGKYCLFDTNSDLCPSEFLKVSFSRLEQLKFLYSDQTEEETTIRVYESTEKKKPILYIDRISFSSVITISSYDTGFAVLDVSKQKGSFPSLHLHTINLSLRSTSDVNVLETAKILVDSASKIIFNGIMLRTFSFVTANTKYPNFANCFIMKESTALTISVDFHVKSIIFYESKFSLVYDDERRASFSCSFLSVSIRIIERTFPVILNIESKTTSTSSLPGIIPTALRGITFNFNDSCYSMTAKKRCIISKPVTGSVTFRSNMGYSPASFLLPLEAKNVYYEFNPKQTIIPTSKSPLTVTNTMVYSIYYIFVALIIIIVCIVVARTVVPKHMPELPQEMLMNSISTLNSISSSSEKF